MSFLLHLTLAFFPLAAFAANETGTFSINEIIYDKVTQREYKINKIDFESKILYLSTTNEQLNSIQRRPHDVVKQSANLNGLYPNHEVSFFSESLGDYDYGIVKRIYKNGIVIFQVREFKNNGSYFVFQKYKSHISQLGVPIESTSNMPTISRTICFEGKYADISTLFSNGTAKLIFGDFFGHRFFIFERWKIVDLSQIAVCE